MQDPKPQVAAGKVHWAFMMSLDGFVAGPGHTMDFMNRATTREGLLEEYIEVTGAVLAGRDGYDSDVGVNPYGGRWQGPIFVLTHHPEDARPADNVTFLDCSVEEARPDRSGGGQGQEPSSALTDPWRAATAPRPHRRHRHSHRPRPAGRRHPPLRRSRRRDPAPAARRGRSHPVCRPALPANSRQRRTRMNTCISRLNKSLS